HANAIGAGPQNVEGDIGCVNFKYLVLIETANADVDCAFRQTNLHGAIIQIEERKTCHLTETTGVRIDAKFGARALIGPEFVAGGHGPVYNGVDPFIRTRGSK